MSFTHTITHLELDCGCTVNPEVLRAQLGVDTSLYGLFSTWRLFPSNKYDNVM